MQLPPHRLLGILLEVKKSRPGFMMEAVNDEHCYRFDYATLRRDFYGSVSILLEFRFGEIFLSLVKNELPPWLMESGISLTQELSDLTGIPLTPTKFEPSAISAVLVSGLQGLLMFDTFSVVGSMEFKHRFRYLPDIEVVRTTTSMMFARGKRSVVVRYRRVNGRVLYCYETRPAAGETAGVELSEEYASFDSSAGYIWNHIEKTVCKFLFAD